MKVFMKKKSAFNKEKNVERMSKMIKTDLLKEITISV